MQKFSGEGTPLPDPTLLAPSAPTALKLNVTPPEKILRHQAAALLFAATGYNTLRGITN